MSFSLFNLGLSALLGYSLFVGLSGRFLPWVKPAVAAKRPTWFLALWVGVTVAVVLGIAMHYSQAQPLSQAIQLAQPVGLILAALWVPGVAGSVLYRRQLSIDSARTNNTASAIAVEAVAKQADNAAVIEPASTHSVAEDATAQAVDAINTAADTADTADATDTATETEWAQHYEFEFDTVDDEDIQFDEVISTDDHRSFSLVFDTADAATENANSSQPKLSNRKCALLLGAGESDTSATNDNASKSTDEANSVSEHEALMATPQNDLERLMHALEAEKTLREHTETHLRITRKALKNLEGDTRNIENEKADALMAVEVQLDQRVKEIAAASAKASREEMQRIAAETAVANMKQDLLQSKREMRRNTEARAKALETANKSVAFARQSMVSRTRAEARIKQLESRLKQSQETVSSLIAALEKEKAHTEHDITEMAKELILQKKRMDEKRTLDAAGRKTQKRLTRRIARNAS